MKVGCKTWLEANNKIIFGKGYKILLKKVDEFGSLRKAAASMEMSYSKAWNLISNLEKSTDIKILQKKIGGIDGGGSSLTKEGKELLGKYERLEKEVEKAVLKIYDEIF